MAKVPNLSQLRPSKPAKASNRLEDVPDSPLSQSGRLAEKLKEAAGKKPLDDYGPPVTEYYRQPRFACGQLFVGTVVTSLVVNTFYNPSLCQLVSKMITTEVAMVKVSRDWVGKSYFEFFDHLLYTDQLLAIGIYRVVGGAGKKDDHDDDEGFKAGLQCASDDKEARTLHYVYTAPPGKETTMTATDRVLCFAEPSNKRALKQED